jgi:hypothetical protein
MQKIRGGIHVLMHKPHHISDVVITLSVHCLGFQYFIGRTNRITASDEKTANYL